MSESKSKRWARKRKARIQRDKELGVRRLAHDETCLVYDTGGGVCDCGETNRRAEQRQGIEWLTRHSR